MQDYDLEIIHRIHSGDGFFYEVTTDADTLECIEVRYFDNPKDQKPAQVILLTQEAVPMLIKALQVQMALLKEKADGHED